MSSYYGNSNSYAPSAPSAPSLPDSYGQQKPPATAAPYYPGQNQPPPQQQQPPHGSFPGQVPSYAAPDFPPGTHPDVIRSFQMVDRDRSGMIDEFELQQALSSGYQKFSIRTVRFILFLFKSPRDPLKMGPQEFAALWPCLGQWRSVFERYDRDRSGKIDVMELRDAFYGLGYAVPASVLQLLISLYGNGSGRAIDFSFDTFVECGMLIRGLTEKFKEKDRRHTGSATFTYEDFMSSILPFIVSYN